MRFSKKSRYGIRALVDLSVNSKTEQVSLSSIAERNGISAQYLEQVFASLKRAGLVKSIKGPQGGYLLNREANQITVAEMIEALEGSYKVEPEIASEESSCRGIAVSIQKLVIDRVNDQLDRILTQVTLADLEKDYLDYNRYDQDMYYI